jgi:L-amino acid N-acyltransferase YncA
VDGWEIREAVENDWPGIWAIFRAVVQGGDAYAFSPDTTEAEARGIWLAENARVYVSVRDGEVLGSSYIKPNQPGLGAHVSNAGFMVAPSARGLGIGRALGEHALAEARRLGYLAMQFNFVVSTNEPAVKLWRALGFDVVGVLPKAFRHARLGLVDAYVMHRFLE